MTLDASLDYHSNNGVLPNFVSPAQILKDALPALDAGEDLTVTECAEQYRYVDGQLYDRETAAYMTEPQDMTSSRIYKAVIFAGSVQSSKTFGLIENVMLHRVICNPGHVHITQMDKEMAGKYSRERIEGMLLSSPQFRERLKARGESLGNVFNKFFNGPMTVSVGWPVKSQLASRSIPTMLTTDRDRMGDDIEGEGDILSMMLARNKTLMSRGMSVIESSPGRDITDEDWVPETVHQAPPCKGTLGYYNSGTRGRYYWTCPHCQGKFEPDFKHLRYADEGSPLERAETVYMLCPLDKCGGVIEQGQKHALNQPKNGGGWLHEHRNGKDVVPIGDPNIRRAEYASYWQKGVIAAFQTWQSMVAEYLSALESFEATGDEATLKTVTNTVLGHPFLSRNRASSLEISGQKLQERAEFRDLDVAPFGTCFITVSVDVQPNRFVVGVDAWGAGLERWLINRYDLINPPSHAPGAESRALQTNLYGEDWALLNDLHEKVFPVLNEKGEVSHGLRPAVVIIDSGGAPGTTTHAYDFWREKHRARQTEVYHLYKGASTPNAPRAKLRQPDNMGGKKYKNRLVPKIVFANTNMLKDEVMASLVREEPGPNTFHLPESLALNIFDEFAAERKNEKGTWEKKPGKVRNESLDLGVMGKAGAIVRGAEKINWDSPPVWAMPDATNKYAVLLDADGNVTEQKQTGSRSANLAAVRSGFIKKR